MQITILIVGVITVAALLTATYLAYQVYRAMPEPPIVTEKPKRDVRMELYEVALRSSGRKGYR